MPACSSPAPASTRRRRLPRCARATAKWQVQDGPFADTKEQLGGFYVIDVPDRDAALAWARRYPHSFGRAVEVRRNLTGYG